MYFFFLPFYCSFLSFFFSIVYLLCPQIHIYFISIVNSLMIIWTYFPYDMNIIVHRGQLSRPHGHIVWSFVFQFILIFDSPLLDFLFILIFSSTLLFGSFFRVHRRIYFWFILFLFIAISILDLFSYRSIALAIFGSSPYFFGSFFIFCSSSWISLVLGSFLFRPSFFLAHRLK